MAAVVVTLAQAVVDALNAASDAGSLALRFVATRSNTAPVYDLTELADLHVTITPALHVVEALDLAGRKKDEWEVSIWVQRKAGPDNEETDPLMLLCQQIEDLFDPWRRQQGRQLIRIENRPATTPQQQDTRGIFTSIVTLTLRVTR